MVVTAGRTTSAIVRMRFKTSRRLKNSAPSNAHRIFKFLGNLWHCSFAVALQPNRGSGFVQAMDPMSLSIVNEQFIMEFARKSFDALRLQRIGLFLRSCHVQVRMLTFWNYGKPTPKLLLNRTDDFVRLAADPG